ncbi:MAG: hypothetical protein A2445_00690 [Candidatus Jacksonbacteria bacterium RIFOXYC2_FULL_44_29]|nr:MAG: hypothetical protein UW45_C0010G0005 [Parcubacteria group bacterium GW2011_GWC2_44_22]OGY76073.1 MAG: hypothetical protein A2295_03905 [Candidatus Jacksonbacteria bacterium RIFOXYB2_FULL_44_15]OGY76376.1 MAG: hypothetical protein A2240_04420 [Candidatus Jacksonbacteria bacterium RIFOXYA2_FULL_43_12]OGY78014.1 MAG: hypothetical protein A2445_00690 [Candidatus Jacksonbacteria bacterium RIFOXYC2_FULL_44_29]OGY80314.1 MAG: hypothetical protein A2550_04395 [Candidatus Jacksonbacteria bacteri
MEYALRQIIGLTLWWSEGTKSRRDKRWKKAVSYPVEITNTDPAIVKIFLAFLRNDVGINESRLKVQLQIHADNNQKDCEEFWSKVTQIPKLRFHKTIIRPIGNKPGKTMGTCKIRYHDKKTYNIVTNGLNQLLRQLNSGV